MNWRHRIAVVMLTCLAALPLAGTVCAMTCVSGARAAATHHRDGQDCESAMPAPASTPAAPASASPESSEASAGSESAAKIGALSAYHCGTHEAALPQVAATDVRRADLAASAAPVTSDRVDPWIGSISALDSLREYTPPLDTAPLTTTPAVLRV